MEIGAVIRDFVKKNDLGRVMSNDSFVKTRSNPDSVRGPDMAYFSFERLPKGQMPEGLLTVSPDLVVKVRSPSDRWVEMLAKASEFLAADVRAVVILDPETTTAYIYRADEVPTSFQAGQELTIPEVLPNFAVSVRRLFE